MKNDFWKKLKVSGKPVLALAPMAGFSDAAFRQICQDYGAKVVFSEMASAAALFYNRSRLNNPTLAFLKNTKRRGCYYVVQLFGSEPEHFAVAAKVIEETIKPDGLDINFGCPVPKINKQGAGAALMKDWEKARAVIEAVLANTNLPVSIKIRAGVGSVSALEFLEKISDLPLSALTIHGRTLKQGFVGAPDWRLVRSARRCFSGVILANGGIFSLADAKKALRETKADGLSLGRGVLGRPWLFAEIAAGKKTVLSEKEIFALAYRHASLENKEKGSAGIVEFRKHLVWYLQGLPGAARLRADAVRVSKLEDVAALFAPNRDLELSIDTASREEIIVALRAGGRQIARKRIFAPRHQAEKLLPLIDKILKENDFVPADLKRLVVANRGGSFTSLRIGVITANALAYALKVPVVAADGSAASQWQFSSYHLIEPDYEREPNIGISKKKPLV